MRRKDLVVGQEYAVAAPTHQHCEGYDIRHVRVLHLEPWEDARRTQWDKPKLGPAVKGLGVHVACVNDRNPEAPARESVVLLSHIWMPWAEFLRADEEHRAARDRQRTALAQAERLLERRLNQLVALAARVGVKISRPYPADSGYHPNDPDHTAIHVYLIDLERLLLAVQGNLSGEAPVA